VLVVLVTSWPIEEGRLALRLKDGAGAMFFGTR